MRVPVIRRIESAFVALVVFATFALAPLCQAYAQDASAGSLMAAQGVTKTTLDDEASDVVTEPVQVVYKGVGVSKCAEVQGSGWGEWTNGTTIGDAGGKGVRAIELKLTGLQGLSGSIRYQTYKRGSGWQQAAADGASSGSTRNVEAVRIKLKGDVAQHYDVLYRVYMSGSGWGAWAKNNGTTGSVNKKKRVLAVQVKLSSKTEEARGKTTSTRGVFYQARLYSAGWQVWKRDGGVAGQASKRLRGLAVQVDAGKLKGSLTYRAYGKNGWGDWKASGAYAAASGNRLEAIQVKLTGALSKKYDVYYCAYAQGVGWLDWTKNGKTAGSTGYNLRLEKFRIKLVKKGAAAPGGTSYPTVNKMETSKTMDGIDIASWQAGINIYKVSADFVIVKATESTTYTNPYFKRWANQVLASGKQLGIYHFMTSTTSAKKQADYFCKAVKPYIGKAVLFLDWENTSYSNVLAKGPSFAKQWLDRVYAKTGVRPLIYMSQSVTWGYNWSSVAKKYGLWLAQYLYANEYRSGYIKNPTHWDIGYWKRETVYQYSSTAKIKGYGARLDVNKFYGSVLTWRKLAQKR